MPSEFDSYKWITPNKKQNAILQDFLKYRETVNMINNLIRISLYSSFVFKIYIYIYNLSRDMKNI